MIGPNPGLGTELLLQAVQADPRQIAYAAHRQRRAAQWFAVHTPLTAEPVAAWARDMAAMQMWLWQRRFAL